MELSNSKILIASDGDKTYIIINGASVVCSDFTFHTDGIDVAYSANDVIAARKFTIDDFFTFVENNLGYKLRSK